jgi:hypothetical protein
MTKQSASTYVSAPIDDAGDEAALTACRTEAVERLGGTDGVMLVSAHLIDGPAIGATFRREWEEKPAEKPAEDPPQG